MKKLLIAALVSTFALSAQAEGWYVQGDLGYSKAEIEYMDTGFNVIDDSAFTQRISGGYSWGNWRAAIDYTNFGKVSRSVSYGYRSAELSAKIKSLGLTGFYDFNNFSKDFKPYVGLRLSSNHFKLSGSAYTGYSSYSEEGTDRVGGIGVLAGVNYKLTEKLDLNLGAEYNRLSAETSQFGVNAGLRYNF